VAVNLAANAVGNLNDRKMLIIGAGEAGQLVAKAARDRGVTRIVVASRTQERASSLTEMLGGIPISINDMEEELNSCNIVVTCAESPHYILDITHVKAAMRDRADLPLVIIDIAVPRNVDPMVTQVKNVFLHNIDELSQISEQNHRQRQSEVSEAEKIISSELDKFTAWWKDHKVRPLVTAIMSKAEEIRRSHLERTVKTLPPLSDEELYNLDMMTKAIVLKILKDPIENLKSNGHRNHDYTR